MTGHPSILVLGIGNLLWADEGFGVRCAEALAERFALPLQLPAAVENASGLVFAARRLTSALAGWLTARQSGVRGFTLRLLHRQSETPLQLQFAELTADNERFERILREKLDRLTLNAPVESIRLEATRVETLTGRNHTLFAEAAQETTAGIGALLEHFSARLGEQAVYRLALQADHRPECATRQTTVLENTAPNPSASPPRPLWLLEQPEPLAEVDGRPYRQGPLQLLAGPERIESGWWDRGETTGEENIEAVGDIRRDYFIARSPGASCRSTPSSRRRVSPGQENTTCSNTTAAASAATATSPRASASAPAW